MTRPTAAFARLAHRPSAVDVAERSVRQAILDGQVDAGERLPPERELAERLGLSRLTLRAALSRLTAAGLLVVKQGSGYVVSDYLRRGGPDLLATLAERAERDGELGPIASDLLLVRRQLARAMLERLVGPIRPGAPARVSRAIDGLAKLAAAGASTELLAGADLDVLAAVLDETDSTVLRLCLNPITALVRRLPALRDALYAEPATNLLGWRTLAAWLGRRRANEIEPLMAALAAHDAETLRRLARATRKAARDR